MAESTSRTAGSSSTTSTEAGSSGAGAALSSGWPAARRASEGPSGGASLSPSAPASTWKCWAATGSAMRASFLSTCPEKYDITKQGAASQSAPDELMKEQQVPKFPEGGHAKRPAPPPPAPPRSTPPPPEPAPSARAQPGQITALGSLQVFEP